MKMVMVLNDDETFTNLDGCKIIGVPDDYSIEDIEDVLRDDLPDGELPRGVEVLTIFKEYG